MNSLVLTLHDNWQRWCDVMTAIITLETRYVLSFQWRIREVEKV